jgi:hypothetical protein
MFIDPAQGHGNNWAVGGWHGGTTSGEVWGLLDEHTGRRIDIVDASGLTDIVLSPGESLFDGLQRQYPARFEGTPWQLHELKFAPGEYHPRMARPWTANPYARVGISPDFEGYKCEIASLAGQLATLIRRLQEICENGTSARRQPSFVWP